MARRDVGRHASGRVRAADPQAIVRTLGVVVLVTVVVLLASLAAIVLYGLELERAPRTLAERTLAITEAAVKEHPQEARNWLAYAYALIDSGLYTEAGDAIARGRKVEDLPGFSIAEAYRAERRGAEEQAIELYERAKEHARTYREALNERLAEESGATIDAPNQDLVEAALGKARLLAKRGDLEAALEEYAIAIDEQPTMADVLAERAQVRERLGDVSGAREDYERALALVPDLAAAREGLERLQGSDR